MMDIGSNLVPEEATRAFEIALELFKSKIVGVYLYGSAVIGGLRVNSDVDVLVTLARMWMTAVTGEISPKYVAAEWAIPRLPKEKAKLLDLAGKAYRGECIDNWEGLGPEAAALVYYMKRIVESCLSWNSTVNTYSI
ncbi:MAG TPA: aminoglycoside adenylyltransferase domain-containing protein [Clostridia bacterium]